MAEKKSKNKNNGCLQSINSFHSKYGKAIGAFAAVATVSFTAGYRFASVSKERELMSIETKYSKEILSLKEEYMDKYYQLREQQLVVNQKDATDGNKRIQNNP